MDLNAKFNNHFADNSDYGIWYRKNQMRENNLPEICKLIHDRQQQTSANQGRVDKDKQKNNDKVKEQGMSEEEMAFKIKNELSIFEAQALNAIRISATSNRETQAHLLLSTQLSSTASSLRSEIIQLRVQIDQENQNAAYCLQHSALADMINQLPEREESMKERDMLEKDIEKIERRIETLKEKKDELGKEFGMFCKVLKDLAERETFLVEEETQSMDVDP